jgi:heat shock protein HtpX
MKTSREAEYEADAFSCDLGYGRDLVSFFRILETLEDSSQDQSNIFAALSASHPETSSRIARIQSRGYQGIDAPKH